MYSDVFCKVYNEFGWNYYPEIFGQQLLLWLQRRGIAPKTCMDLGCGTGILCEILHSSGIRAAGMDFSSGMIDIARQGNPEISYEVADMITFCPDAQYDLVTCTGDALNHIRELSHVAQIFRNVYRYTASGGYFIFDLLNPKEAPEGEPFLLDFSPQVQAIFQITRPEEALVKLEIQVFEDGKTAFTQAILETIHDADAVQALLELARCSVTRGNTLIPDPDRRSTTWYFIARK